MKHGTDVKRVHAQYDIHPAHRIRLFGAVAAHVRPRTTLYPGSYVDIAPSVLFPDVTYVDTDKRAVWFFSRRAPVTGLIQSKRTGVTESDASFDFRFLHADYRKPLDVEDRSVDLLISLYAGFVSEHCTRYLATGGHLFANNSHGDASMASLNPLYELVAVVIGTSQTYKLTTTNLDAYLIPKNGKPPTVDALHSSGRGIAYTRSPYGYLFRKR